MELVGKRIAQVLEEQGRKRIWLAEKLGVSPGHLTRLLQGERPWTEDLVERAAGLLGIRMEDLRRG
jgi:transcriptional regulator with XRE-family HTH domain